MEHDDEEIASLKPLTAQHESYHRTASAQELNEFQRCLSATNIIAGASILELNTHTLFQDKQANVQIDGELQNALAPAPVTATTSSIITYKHKKAKDKKAKECREVQGEYVNDHSFKCPHCRNILKIDQMTRQGCGAKITFLPTERQKLRYIHIPCQQSFTINPKEAYEYLIQEGLSVANAADIQKVSTRKMKKNRSASHILSVKQPKQKVSKPSVNVCSDLTKCLWAYLQRHAPEYYDIIRHLQSTNPAATLKVLVYANSRELYSILIPSVESQSMLRFDSYEKFEEHFGWDQGNLRALIRKAFEVRKHRLEQNQQMQMKMLQSKDT